MEFLHLKSLPDAPSSPLVHPLYPDVEVAVIETENVPAFLFKGSTKLQRVIFTDKVRSIAPYAFFECVGLRSVQFSHGLRKIGDFAFDGVLGICSDIIIPASTVHIGVGAFRNSCRDNGANQLLFIPKDSLSYYPHDEDRKFGLHFLNCEKMTVLKREIELSKEEKLGYLLERFVLDILDDHKDGKYKLKI